MSQTHEKTGPELAESSQEQVLTNGEARNQGAAPTWDDAVIENGKEYAPRAHSGESDRNQVHTSDSENICRVLTMY